jgi:hypothetical protein
VKRRRAKDVNAMLARALGGAHDAADRELAARLARSLEEDATGEAKPARARPGHRTLRATVKRGLADRRR